MEIHFIKTHSSAVLPKQGRAHSNSGDLLTGDTGYDISSVEDVVVPAKGSVVVPVGLKLAYITPGYWFRIEGRSGLGFKQGIQPHFGIIDNNYRGDLGIKLYNLTNDDVSLSAGSRIAQLIVYPIIHAHMEFTEIEDVTERGDKGFGSSGL